MGVNLVPRDDQSEFQVTIITPEGYTLERAERVFARNRKSTEQAARRDAPLYRDRRKQQLGRQRARRRHPRLDLSAA